MSIRHTVVQGECISSIAHRYGFFPDTVWNAPDNAALRAERADPNVLLAGDMVVIPDIRQRYESCPTGARHVFRRKGVPQRIQICLTFDSRPRAGVEYQLDVDGQQFSGTTDDGGNLTHWVSPQCKHGVLILPGGEQYEVEFGHLDPISTRAGLLARLVNLAYLDETDDGDELKTQEALIRFKVDWCGLSEPPPDLDDVQRAELATIDGALLDALVARHGS